MSLEERIDQIEARNKKVESDKRWETSFVRRILLLFLTYLACLITMLAINTPNPFFNALIPTLGYFLSTLTLPLAKTFWEKISGAKIDDKL